MSGLSDFITSRVRVKILDLFFAHPEDMYYIREVTREIGEEINAVRRELNQLVDKGMLKTEDRANRSYYFLNRAYPFYSELQQIVMKERGLALKIRKNRKKLGTVEFVMFSSQFINREANKTGNDLDMLVIGEVVLPELELLVKEEEKELGREINYTVLDANEFKFRKQRRDPFIMDIMYGKKIMVIGNEDDFVDRTISFSS